jgi:hypothetical protein
LVYKAECSVAFCLLHTGLRFWYTFQSENRCDMFFLNLGYISKDHTAVRPREDRTQEKNEHFSENVKAPGIKLGPPDL